MRQVAWDQKKKVNLTKRINIFFFKEGMERSRREPLLWTCESDSCVGSARMYIKKMDGEKTKKKKE